MVTGGDCMSRDGIYHSACHVGRGEGSKGDSGTKGVIHTTRDSSRYGCIYIKRGSLLGNEEIHLGGDSPIFEIIYRNLEQRSIFAKKSTHFYVRINIWVK